MDESTYRHLVEDHARFPTVLLNIFQGAEADFLREREASDKWSPLEILAHLRDEETLDFGDRARAVVEGREIETGIDPEGWVVERAYNEMDPGAVFLDFAEKRAGSCQWLGERSMSDLEKAIEHPRAGRMRAGDFIAAWRMHDLLHLRQFATAMAVLTARRLGEWRIDYAGTLPPGATS